LQARARGSMEAKVYGLGVTLAILSGAAHNVGLIIQKKAINEIDAGEERFFSSLFHSPLWVVGFLINFVFGTVFFLLAQRFLGPALIPGLMAVGLVVLVIGSVRILSERLSFNDLLGIVLLIAATALLGLSRLTIDVARFEVLAGPFLLRAAVFSLLVILLWSVLEIARRRSQRYSGLYLALTAGLLYALSNFWVGPFMGAVLRIFAGLLTWPVLALFAATSAILVLTNVLAIGRMQLAFRVTDASLAVPVQQVPVQAAPALVYLAVFRLPSPFPAALPLFCLSAALILASTFILARRQGRIAAVHTRERQPDKYGI
jgi:hypothetical protein